jgi:hypothetical protein
LAGLRVTGELGQHHEVVESHDAQAGGPFDQHVQEVGRGEGVVEGAVDGR